MSIEIHKETILGPAWEEAEFDKLIISYEPETRWYSSWEQTWNTDPEAAVLLYTKCCTNNHEHISLNKEQATVLRDWLTKFIDGEFHKVVNHGEVSFTRSLTLEK